MVPIFGKHLGFAEFCVFICVVILYGFWIIGKIHSQLPGIQVDETPGQDPSSKMAMGGGERW